MLSCWCVVSLDIFYHFFVTGDGTGGESIYGGQFAGKEFERNTIIAQYLGA